MKKIKYQLLCKQTKMVLNDEGVPTFVEEDVLSEIETDYLESECERIKLIAYNGEYTVEDDGIEEIIAPTQLDRVEAQVTYTAMMTDTLLEV